MFLYWHLVLFKTSSLKTQWLSRGKLQSNRCCWFKSPQGRCLPPNQTADGNTPMLVTARYNPLYSYPSIVWFCQKSAGLQKSSVTTLTKASTSDSQSVSFSSPTHLYTSIYTHRAEGRENKISPRVACPYLFTTRQIAFFPTQSSTYYLVLVKLTEKF